MIIISFNPKYIFKRIFEPFVSDNCLTNYRFCQIFSVVHSNFYPLLRSFFKNNNNLIVSFASFGLHIII
jgi:hypothetical protein